MPTAGSSPNQNWGVEKFQPSNISFRPIWNLGVKISKSFALRSKESPFMHINTLHVIKRQNSLAAQRPPPQMNTVTTPPPATMFVYSTAPCVSCVCVCVRKRARRRRRCSAAKKTPKPSSAPKHSAPSKKDVPSSRALALSLSARTRALATARANSLSN